MDGDLTETGVMTDRLSPERLAPYVEAGGGDLNSAFELYVRNTSVSVALAATIGHVEVILRNAIHQNLTSWSTQRFAEPRWYLDSGGLLEPRQTAVIRRARQRAVQYGRYTETPGRVVAELPFGFWRFLLTGQYDTTLWRQSLFHVFPGQRQRRAIQDAVEVLHLSRNRIAHHEPMFNRPIADIQVTALTLTEWICPVSRKWVERRCSVNQVLGRRPG
ncbi:Abi family protein [Actinoplanes sp. Pm04-4]|uniref:Abi family protein n=1 Tax=Paractinoplanes pyxinae TaxID=2997416 RepID=A0ABT4B700_9ACTN|nr:Abi family protein [Actinoplanes pyxinae]MCY1141807.1 Abi family protein [Actinoplanes pyxinae]